MDRGRVGVDLLANKIIRENQITLNSKYHEKKIKEIMSRKPGSSIYTLDNNPPTTLEVDMIGTSLRKKKIRADSDTITERKNKILLQRLGNILTAPPKITDDDYVKMKNIVPTIRVSAIQNFEECLRKKRLQKLQDRVKSMSSVYNTKVWEDEYKSQLSTQEKYMRQVKYRRPKDFKDPFVTSTDSEDSYVNEYGIKVIKSKASSAPSNLKSTSQVTQQYSNTFSSSSTSHLQRVRTIKKDTIATGIKTNDNPRSPSPPTPHRHHHTNAHHNKGKTEDSAAKRKVSVKTPQKGEGGGGMEGGDGDDDYADDEYEDDTEPERPYSNKSNKNRNKDNSSDNTNNDNNSSGPGKRLLVHKSRVLSIHTVETTTVSPSSQDQHHHLPLNPSSLTLTDEIETNQQTVINPYSGIPELRVMEKAKISMTESDDESEVDGYHHRSRRRASFTSTTLVEVQVFLEGDSTLVISAHTNDEFLSKQIQAIAVVDLNRLESINGHKVEDIFSDTSETQLLSLADELSEVVELCIENSKPTLLLNMPSELIFVKDADETVRMEVTLATEFEIEQMLKESEPLVVDLEGKTIPLFVVPTANERKKVLAKSTPQESLSANIQIQRIGDDRVQVQVTFLGSSSLIKPYQSGKAQEPVIKIGSTLNLLCGLPSVMLADDDLIVEYFHNVASSLVICYLQYNRMTEIALRVEE